MFELFKGRKHFASKYFASTLQALEGADMRHTNTPPDKPDETGTEEKHDSHDASFSLAALSAVLMGLAALPKAFEQHPRGGLTVTVLLILALISWIAVTWIQYH